MTEKTVPEDLLNEFIINIQKKEDLLKKAEVHEKELNKLEVEVASIDDRLKQIATDINITESVEKLDFNNVYETIFHDTSLTETVKLERLKAYYLTVVRDIGKEDKFLNNSRMHLNTSCAISGTGFMVSSEIIQKNGGWIHHLLTEDIEFTVDSVIKGETIGYCSDAILYDEQPTSFKQSYTQRLRWAKGFYQVFANYGGKLFTGIFKGSFACYDMLMTVMPSMLLTLISAVINLVAIPMGIIADSPETLTLIKTLLQTIGNFYGLFFILGAITTITEWNQIHCRPKRIIANLFTFPIFMLSYVPIAVIALFKKVEWKPIKHSVATTIDEIHNEQVSI